MPQWLILCLFVVGAGLLGMDLFSGLVEAVAADVAQSITDAKP